jgi:hypothetical protein
MWNGVDERLEDRLFASLRVDYPPSDVVGVVDTVLASAFDAIEIV